MSSLPSQLLHDLRNPLNQIIGYSEMLTEEADGQRREGFTSDLEKIRAAGHRMLALIEENFTSENPSIASAAVGHDFKPRTEAPRTEAPRTEDKGIAPGLLLVVDDDASNRDVLSRRLKRQGHVVKTASRGRDALQLMRDTAFDLVLLDIMMPNMDGYEVLTHIKSDDRLRRVPVIMISAVSEVQSVVRCIEAGAED
ncbi:MAG TPA: response regulator, partial [Thermoanaerobaculia bacterium]|nr:response regulator [Thermoanaerobaculia bacterium]